MSSRFRRSDPEAEVQAYLDEVRAGRAGQDPRAQTLARSQSPRAQKTGQRMLDDRADANLRQIEDDQRAADQAAEDAAKAQEQAAKDAAKAMEDERKRNVRAMAAQGAVVETDVESGKRTIATHADGAPKFEAGPLGRVEPVAEVRPTLVDGETGEKRTVPNLDIMMGGGAGSDAIGATGSEKQTVFGQQVRDDRGRVSIVEPKIETDKDTGRQTFDQKNPVTGKTETQTVGYDWDAREKAARAAKIDADTQAVALEINALDQQRAQFEPRWQPVKAEYLKAKSELESLPSPLIQRGSTWVKVDERTGKESLATPQEIAYQKKVREQAQARFERAKAAYEPLAGQNETLTKAERDATARRLQVGEEKIRLEAGLPDKDAETLTRALAVQTEAVPDPEAEAVKQAVAPPAAPAAPTSGQAAAPPAKPLVPKDALNADTFAAAFSGIVKPESLTLGLSGDGYRMIQRNGTTIGSIEDSGGAPVVVLNAGLNEDLRAVAALGGTKGVPVYLADGNRQPLAKEAAWATQAIQQAQQAEQAAGYSFTDRMNAREAALQLAGADLPTINRKLRSGEISMQVAETLAKTLHGETFQVADPLAPESFQGWQAENPDKAEAWSKAQASRDIQGMNAVKSAFISDWYAKNQHKPGVTWSMMQAARKAAAVTGTAGDRAADGVKTLGGTLVDAGGSMIGLMAAYPTLAGMGAAVMAQDVFGSGSDGDLGVAYRDMLEARGRANKNFVRGLETNRQKWFTGEGKKATGNLQAALFDFRAAVATRDVYPDGIADPRYQAKFNKALGKVTDAAHALHSLNLEDGWAMTRDDVDPNKDRVLGASLANYIETGDPEAFQQFQRRLLLDKGSREAEGWNQDLVAGQGRFAAAVIGGVAANDFESVIEIASNLATAGVAKAIQTGGKMVSASKLAGAGRVARFGQQVAKDFHKLGMVADTLAKPASKGGKILNQSVKLGKATLAQGLSEGAEGGVAELGNPEATGASVLEAAAIEGLAGIVMGPIMSGPTMAAAQSRQNFDIAAQAQKLVDAYNKTGANDPDFKPITRDQAIVAMEMAQNPARKEALDRLEAAKVELELANNELAGTGAKLASVRREGQEAAAAVPGDQNADTTARADALKAWQEDNARQEQAAQAGKQNAASRYSKALAAYTSAFRDVANIQGSAMEIAASTAGMSPAERAQVIGLAKVAFGKADTLTSTERSAIAGKTTIEGLPYFETTASGTEVLTDAGRADIQRLFPVLGGKIATPQSLALFEAARQSPAATGAPTASLPAGQGGAQAPSTPSPTTAPNGQNTQGPTGQQTAATTAQPAPANANAPGGTVRDGAGQADPANGAGEQAAPSPVSGSAAAMDAAEYAALRAQDPSLPDIPAVVAAARAAGQPVSPSMEKAAGQTVSGNGQPVSQTDRLSPARQLAEQIKARVEAAMPSMKGRIVVSEEASGGGGADLVIETGQIRLMVPDVARALEKLGGDTAAAMESLENIVARHEVVHVVQTDLIRAEWEAANRPGSFSDFFIQWYADLAPELLTKDAVKAARTLYGENAWDRIPTDGQKTAEFVRMLVEAKLEGDTSKFSELFRAVKTRGAKSKLAKLMQAAIAALRKMKLTPAAEAHVSRLVELHRELTEGAPQDTANPAESPQAAATGLRVQATGNTARIFDGETLLWEGPADQAQAELASLKAAQSSPMVLTGAAIKAAIERFPRLRGKLRADLEAAADDVIDAIEALPPEERAAAAEKAIADRINLIADREAERTGKAREEVIEGFRAVAGKRAAKQAASIEQAVIGTEAPQVPAGRQERRDTPNSEMTVDVTSTFVDLDQLIGSSDPLFPGGALQPRNRASQASANQREEMVQNIRDKDDQHRRYLEGATTDSGRIVVAPLFAADGTHMTNDAGKPLFYVISGNGRRNALQEASARKVAGKIDKGFRETAAAEGIDTEGMTLPVPVSVFVPTSAKEAIDLAEYSNRDAQLSVSNTEQANRDAASIEKAGILKLWEPDASGDPGAASNRDFVRAFARAVGDEGIVDGRGNLTEEGGKRIERAMVAMLLGPEQADLLDILFNQSGTYGLRAILGGIASETGSLLKVASEKPDFDLSPVLADALRTAVQAKAALVAGEIRDVGEFFDQGNLFESTDNSTPERQLARALVESRSRKAVREILGAYRRGAEAVDTGTMSMFAEAETTREDLILKALEARPIEQVAAEVEAEFGSKSDLARKLNLAVAGVKKLDAGQRRDFVAAIGAEVERLRGGIYSAEEWQRLNPDALTPKAALFQRFLDSHTPETIQSGLNRLLSKPAQTVLASSALGSHRFSEYLEAAKSLLREKLPAEPAGLKDVPKISISPAELARQVAGLTKDTMLGIGNRRAVLGSSPFEDPRLTEVFGENYKADEYGLPAIPKTLPDGHPLLQQTDKKEFAEIAENHPLVIGMDPRNELVRDLPEDHPARLGGFLKPGKMPRKQFHDAVIKFFMSLGTPLPDGVRPTVYATGGGGGAGKSSILRYLKERGDLDTTGAIPVNADEIKSMIPEWDLFIQAKDGRAAGVVHEESSILAKRLVETILNNGWRYSFIYDATLANTEKAIGMFGKWRNNGYFVHLIGVSIDPREAIIRAILRGRKSWRWVPVEELTKAHAGFNRGVMALAKAAHFVNIFDNTPPKPHEIAKKIGDKEQISIVNQEYFGRIQSRERQIQPQSDGQSETLPGGLARQDPERSGRDRPSGDRAGAQVQPQGRSADQTLGSSPAPELDLFGAIEAQITGPRAKTKRNALAAAKAQPEGSKARENIGKRVAAIEGLADLDLFAAASVRSLDAKPKKSESAPDGSAPRQPGNPLDPQLHGGQPAKGTRGAGTVGGNQDLFDWSGRPGAEAGGTSRQPAASDVQGTDAGLRGSGDGSAATNPDLGGRGSGPGRPAESGEGGGSDSGNAGRDGGKRSLTQRQRPKAGTPERNFEITPNTVLAEGGAVTRIRNNVAAIDLLRTLEREDRNATAEEKAVLAKFVGWGGLPQVFDEENARKVEQGEAETRRETARRYESYGAQYENLRASYREQADAIDKWNEKWGDHYRKLRELLTPEEWESARESIINAHYTSPTVISSMWDAVRRLGFKGGNVLEPAGGIGHFYGLMPQDMMDTSRLFGIELDSVSGRIMGKLYPEAEMEITGFQDSTLPDNSQDLVISNVPFANINVTDEWLAAQPDAPAFNLHNYFFERALRKTRPGGLVAFISTANTMDAQIKQRKWLAERSDFMGAIRLPNNAFKGNANTEVVTDIIFLRKPDGSPNPMAAEQWTSTEDVALDNGETIDINEYFARHPEMILGRLANDGSMYGGKKEMTVHGSGDLKAQLAEAVAKLPENVIGGGEAVDIERDSKQAAGAKDGAFIEENGKVRIKGDLDPVPTKELGRVRSFIKLRDTLNELYRLEADPAATDSQIAAQRAALNRAYDGHKAVYGTLHERANKKTLETDPDFYRTLGLEVPLEKKALRKQEYRKADVFSKRILSPRVPPKSADSVDEAVIHSFRWKGRLDAGYVGKLLGIPLEAAESRLLETTAAFRDPASGRIEHATNYLAGNVRRKLRDAQQAAAGDPAYQRNVEALERVMPPPVPWSDIHFKMGSAWIPADVYERFMAEKLFNGRRNARVLYHKGVGDLIGDSFEVQQGVTGYSNSVDVQWGTPRLSATQIVEYVLNQKDPRVYDTVDKKRVYNQAESDKARAAAERMTEAFLEWVSASPELQTDLHRIYNESFNSHVVPQYDGSFMQLPWVASDFDLYPDKKHVVWRALQEGTLLVAHGVGGGKTIIGTAIAMESRRLGLAKKPLIVVHNATLEQFATTISTMAPTARVLVARKEDLAGPKRKEFMGRVRSGDWDAVVMAHSTYDLIPDDPAWERKQTDDLVKELEDAIREQDVDPDADLKKIKDPSVKELVKMRRRLKDRIANLQTRRTDDVLTFQELGIDALIVDEVHRYKKLPFVTRQSNIAGIDTGFSKRGSAMQLRAKWVQAINQGRGVFTMTGTPVTNTVGEAWNMVRLVRPDLLQEFGVKTFDRFVSVFGNITQGGELRPNGSWKAVTRLSKFTNIPEWNRFWGLAADVKMGDDMQVKGRPKIKGGKPALTVVERTPGVGAVIAEISRVIDSYDMMTGREKAMNRHIPLLTYAAARMAAIDIRLINPDAADEPTSKVNTALKNVMRLYHETTEHKGTQVLFADSYRPLKTTKLDLSAAEFDMIADDETAPAKDDEDEGFNLYHDIREKLVAAGVPRSEIAIITEAKNDKAREAIFAKVNSGEVRIILGSTETLGTGVNMQQRMIAAHHLDVPWTPAGLEQRDGRVYRQGNLWAELGREIEIMRYGMKDTLDAALWQKLETKERFIKQAVSGKINERVIEDDDGLLNYMEQKAALSGPDGMLKFTLDEKVRGLKNEWRAHRNRQFDLQRTGDLASRTIQSIDDALADARRVAKVAEPLANVDPMEVEWSVEGGKALKGEDAREAIDAAIKERRKKAGAIMNPESAPTMREPLHVTANGVPLVLQVVSITEDIAHANNPDLRWQFTWAPTLETAMKNPGRHSPHPRSLMGESVALATRLFTQPASLEANRSRAQSDIEMVAKEGAKPFGKAVDFAQALLDQAKLYKRMGIASPEAQDVYQAAFGAEWESQLKAAENPDTPPPSGPRAETPETYPGKGLAPAMATLGSSAGLDSRGNPQGIDTNQPGGANIGDAASPSSVVTPEMDAAYLDALANGNLYEANAIMLEAAGKAGAFSWDDGTPKVLLHGTVYEYDVSEINLENAGQGHPASTGENLLFMTLDGGEAAKYAGYENFNELEDLYDAWNDGLAETQPSELKEYYQGEEGRVFPLFVFPKKLRTLPGKNGKYNFVRLNGLAEKLISSGRADAILMKDTVVTYLGQNPADHMVVGNVNLVRSAATVLRDESGNIILLSQRFNQSPGASSPESMSLGSSPTPDADPVQTSFVRAIATARRELDKRRADRNTVSIQWELDADRLAEDGEEYHYPSITLPEDDRYMEEFLPLDPITRDGDMKFYFSDKPTEFDTLSEAQDYANNIIIEALKEKAPSSIFGSDSDAQNIARQIFDSFPSLPSITSPWQPSKWGSWYLEFKDEEGTIQKLSIRDHSATRADMGLPDKSFFVSKQWNPEEVGNALFAALEYINEKSPARAAEAADMPDGRETASGTGQTGVLWSSPSSDSDPVQIALAKMPPIYREVFEAIEGGASVTEVTGRFNITPRAVDNILNAVRSRIATASAASKPFGLEPRTVGGKMVGGGRPDLALGANPQVAAVDQIRNESGIPGVRGWAEVFAEADAMLAKDYDGTYEALLSKARDLQPMTDTEIAAAKRIISRETLAGKIQTTAERVNLGMLIHGYRDIGTETARSLAIRRDPHLSPAERHARFIAEALFTPDPATRARMRKKNASAEEILAGWMKRVDSIEKELLAQGIDIRAALEEFNDQQEARKQSEAESPRAAAVIDEQIRKLNRREKAVIEAIRSGALVTKAAFITGLSVEEVKAIYSRFLTDIRSAMAESAKRYLAGALGSSPMDTMAEILMDLSLPPLEMIDDSQPGFVDRRGEKPRKPRKPRAKKEGETETKKPKKPAAPKPEGVELTPEQQARLDEDWQRFLDSDLSTWKAYYKGERNRWPWTKEQQLRFEDKAQAIKKDWSKQKDLFTEREEVSTTTGTFDIHDPVSMLKVAEAFMVARGGKVDAIMEYWRMSILSGMQTHVVNIGSTALNIGFNLAPRRALEAMVNTLIRSDKSATFGEFKPMVREVTNAWRLAARNAVRSWQLDWLGSRVFDQYANAEVLQLDFTGTAQADFIPPALGGKFGKVMRSISFRALQTADTFLKSFYSQLEAAAQAHRIAAVEEKLKGAAYDARLAELMIPGSVAWVRALDGAKVAAFQKDMAFEGMGLKAMADKAKETPVLDIMVDSMIYVLQVSRNLPIIGRLSTFFMPFLVTPANINKQAIGYTPMGAFVNLVDATRALKRRIFKGDMSKAEAIKEAAALYDRARLVQDVTNQVIGLAVLAVVAELAWPDDDDELPWITGTTPYKTTRRGERDNAYAVMPPMSIRLPGGVVFSYARFEPFSTSAASMVDFVVALNRQGGMTPAALADWSIRFKDRIKDQSFMQGLSNLFNAVEDPDRWGERLAASTLTGFVPNIIRQPVREMDTELRDSSPREQDGLFTSLAKSIGFSVVPQAAPVKQTVWGEDIPTNRGQSIGPRAVDAAIRIFDPTNLTLNPQADPIDRWIYRWNLRTPLKENRIVIEPIKDKITGRIPGEKKDRVLPLTPQEQADANRRAGRMAREVLGNDWADRPLGPEDALRIKETVSQAQTMIRAELRQRKIMELIEKGPPAE
ncbi:MAG: zeta toxin family protein [Acidobacteriales bacterium]|nr:zeta toxin family protein [Terriglobales bacterium]